MSHIEHTRTTPGQGQAQPVPYTGGGRASYRVRAGLAPALVSETDRFWDIKRSKDG